MNPAEERCAEVVADAGKEITGLGLWINRLVSIKKPSHQSSSYFLAYFAFLFPISSGRLRAISLSDSRTAVYTRFLNLISQDKQAVFQKLFLYCFVPFCCDGSAGAGVSPSQQSNYLHFLYCGRWLGRAAIPGSDGQCGPNNGPCCGDCRAFKFQNRKGASVQHSGSAPVNLWYCKRETSSANGLACSAVPPASQCQDCAELQADARTSPWSSVQQRVVERLRPAAAEMSSKSSSAHSDGGGKMQRDEDESGANDDDDLEYSTRRIVLSRVVPSKDGTTAMQFLLEVRLADKSIRNHVKQ
jgi:hypothetical protein